MLAVSPQGSFLVRPSLSLTGCLVISAVVGGSVKHMALDQQQLCIRSLDVSCISTQALYFVLCMRLAYEQHQATARVSSIHKKRSAV